MSFTQDMNKQLIAGRDYPNVEGRIKITLHNPTTGKNEIYEGKNMVTNALKDIFTGNYGGLVNYQNFADLYSTWLGGVMLFSSSLDTTSQGASDDYGIPAYTSNSCTAHAGQTSLSDQNDDVTRGNPNSVGTVLAEGSTKLVWEWGTSAGNGTISSLGLTHTDTGSFLRSDSAGNSSTALSTFNPFVTVACLDRQYTSADDAGAVLAINNNYAYNIYLVDNTTVHLYKTPINSGAFKLQGGALLPITAYTHMITITLSESYALQGKGDCYYHFDFANNKLLLFGVPSEGGDVLYIDEVNLSTWQDQTATHTKKDYDDNTIKFWKDKCDNGLGSNAYLSVPKKAMVYNNHLYLYGYSSSAKQPNVMYKINLANLSAIDTVDVTNYSQFYYNNTMMVNERFAMLGGIIVHDSFLINGDKTFGCAKNSVQYQGNYTYVNTDSVSSPTFYNRTSTNNTGNVVSVNKLYLATKYNLPNGAVTKTTAQSMVVEYTLTEV